MNIRSPAYAIASTSAVCAVCGAWTHVIALVVPPNHAVRGESAWERAPLRACLFYVEDLAEPVRAAVHLLAPWYRLARSAATGTAYWMNHCEHCGEAQEDHDLHCEPASAFMPNGEDGAAHVECLGVAEPFAAVAGGYSYEPSF